MNAKNPQISTEPRSKEPFSFFFLLVSVYDPSSTSKFVYMWCTSPFQPAFSPTRSSVYESFPFISSSSKSNALILKSIESSPLRHVLLEGSAKMLSVCNPYDEIRPPHSRKNHRGTLFLLTVGNDVEPTWLVFTSRPSRIPP